MDCLGCKTATKEKEKNPEKIITDCTDNTENANLEKKEKWCNNGSKKDTQCNLLYTAPWMS